MLSYVKQKKRGMARPRHQKRETSTKILISETVFTPATTDAQDPFLGIAEIARNRAKSPSLEGADSGDPARFLPQVCYGCSRFESAIVGRSTVKVFPIAGAFSTQILPPWAITRLRAMASPSPLPGGAPDRRTKSPNIL